MIRPGSRVYVDMGKLLKNGHLSLETPKGAKADLVFAPGARFEGVVLSVAGTALRIELRVDPLQGHVIEAPLDCVSERTRS